MSVTESKIFKDDFGHELRVYAGEDLTAATEIIIKLKKPNGTEVEKTATQDSDNPKYAVYTTEDGVIDQKGTWKVSLEVTFSDKSITGITDTFEVYKQFED